jgi:hypothetical protein
MLRTERGRVDERDDLPSEGGMGHFLAVALSFPAVVYTVLLGVALVYWVFVIVGAAHVNLLGEGAADGAADAALDGVAKGALEGATKGMIEGVAEHLDGADADIGDLDGGGAGGVIAALKLRSAPATVVLSVLILFSWILATGGMQLVESSAVTGITATLVKISLLVLSPLIALLPTSLVVRPLAHVFSPPVATKHESLVGKLCTIRTGTVTERFGEATLEDGGAGVVVRVRIETDEKLRRGDQAVIVAYDAERQEFTVAPMEGLLDEERPRKAQKG